MDIVILGFSVVFCFFLLKGGAQRSITATILMCDRQPGNRAYFSVPRRETERGGDKVGPE